MIFLVFNFVNVVAAVSLFIIFDLQGAVAAACMLQVRSACALEFLSTAVSFYAAPEEARPVCLHFLVQKCFCVMIV